MAPGRVSGRRSAGSLAVHLEGARAMISFVIPVHDEEQSLATLHSELDQAVSANSLGPVELLFIDDGSRDGSWPVIRELAARDGRVQAIRFRRNFGKAAALTA